MIEPSPRTPVVQGQHAATPHIAIGRRDRLAHLPTGRYRPDQARAPAGRRHRVPAHLSAGGVCHLPHRLVRMRGRRPVCRDRRREAESAACDARQPGAVTPRCAGRRVCPRGDARAYGRGRARLRIAHLTIGLHGFSKLTRVPAGGERSGQRRSSMPGSAARPHSMSMNACRARGTAADPRADRERIARGDEPGHPSHAAGRQVSSHVAGERPIHRCRGRRLPIRRLPLLAFGRRWWRMGVVKLAKRSG